METHQMDSRLNHCFKPQSETKFDSSFLMPNKFLYEDEKYYTKSRVNMGPCTSKQKQINKAFQELEEFMNQKNK